MTAALCTIGHAELPQKAPLTSYTALWTESPFTSKPPPAAAGTAVNPLDDYALSGIAPVPGGYRITLLNKKNPEEKKVIEPGINSEFTVISVNRNPSKYLGTTVVLSSGAIQGSVTFQPELLVLKGPPDVQQPPNNNLPPGVAPNAANNQQDQNAQVPQRAPRPRIVPPPIPQVQGQPANQAQPQPQFRPNLRQ
ncbi:MAG: hypothetical protein H7Y36_07095 [Armatimonadetes bacterium]|nr:hypothetical protein [Akkermansiaceae bacterium]